MIELKPANSGGYRAYWENGQYIGDVFQGDDGYYAWWPTQNGGCYSQYFLWSMSERLKMLNEKWNQEVRKRSGQSVERTGPHYKPSDSTQEPF